MTSMIEFLETEKLIYLPIYYYIDDNSKKKIPVYEKNNATIEEINSLKDKKNMYPTHKNKKKINGIWSDGTPLSEDESASITEAYSIYLKHTEKLYCVDVDEPEIRNMEDFIAKTGIQIFKNCCWIQGNTKGIHIYLKINNMVDNKDQQNVYKDFCGDLIQKNNMWEKKDKKIQNYKGSLQEFEYDHDILNLVFF